MGLHRRIGAITIALCAAGFLPSRQVLADRFGTTIPMRDKGAATYYVDSYLHGLGPTEMMVDTGSGYLTINEVALKAISAEGNAHYVKQLKGVLANGQELVVPVYRLDGLRIGKECWIHDVQAAVFPGHTRLILGLSALAKASPFIFELDPPQLVLSNCGKANVKTTEAPVAPEVAAVSPSTGAAAPAPSNRRLPPPRRSSRWLPPSLIDLTWAGIASLSRRVIRRIHSVPLFAWAARGRLRPCCFPILSASG